MTIKIDSREPYFKTNKNGEYYRILLPGTYNLTVMLNCTIALETKITIPSASKLLLFNITLSLENYQKYLNSQLNKNGVFCSKIFKYGSESEISGQVLEPCRYQAPKNVYCLTEATIDTTEENIARDRIVVELINDPKGVNF
ncbi:unnamed protein product [Brachionus calyciflorus]|uniref:Uncharacterized protein n=1 Tax=Brachionus calyciflorus TaxID=104777 RepID=A0A814JVI5_9BILA|nr:unnamed protein product [Brachionus calyciflorus]